ncbi:hypothetical protein METP2_02727 [Methanosarcinales archaeon]|nr:hypothetical protein [Candidatus Methanoperedens sp.]CAG0992893.1 hypothetical protein METP2_02727 [Methanosarcinales archaeon]
MDKHRLNKFLNTAILLASLSFIASLFAALFIAERIFAPAFAVLVFIPLLGLIGILKKNKEVLIASALISLCLAILTIVSAGMLFLPSSIILVISVMVCLREAKKEELAEKAKRIAQLAAIASLIAAIGIAVFESSGQKSLSAPLLAAELLFFYLPLILPPILGLAGIRLGNKDYLSLSAAFSMVVAISLMLLSRNPLYLASPVLLIFSVFAYQGGIIRVIKKENIDSKTKKIAFVLAGISIFVAIITTLYIERVLIVDGCYSFQTSTNRVRICEDFRPGYVLPVILSVIGAAGILRNDKIMINTSAALSFVRLVTSLSAIDTLFVPSFAALIISAFVYQKGTRKGDTLIETWENSRQYYLLLLLFAVLIIWIFSVYIFIHPNTSGGSGGYFPPDHP